MNTKNVVMITLLLSLGLAISAQAQAPVPGEANLLVWLKADDGVQNSSNTGPATVGSATGNWLDKSDKGTDAIYVQGTMELETANFGDPAADYNVVRFHNDGWYQFSNDPNTLLENVATVFAVIKTRWDEVGRSTYFQTLWWTAETGATGYTCDVHSTGLLQTYTSCNGPCNNDYFPVPYAPEGYHILVFRYDEVNEFKSINPALSRCGTLELTL